MRLLGIRVPQSSLAVSFNLLFELTVQFLHASFPNFFLKGSEQIATQEDVIVLRVLNRLYKWYFFKDMKKSLYCHLKCLNLAERFAPGSELIHCYMLGGYMGLYSLEIKIKKICGTGNQYSSVNRRQVTGGGSVRRIQYCSADAEPASERPGVFQRAYKCSED